MQIKEFRIVMPLTVDQYQIGQLYSVSVSSLNESGGGEGVEIVKNEPFENHPMLGGRYSKGQYTYKIYRIKSRIPSFIRLMVPNGATEFHEEAWNAYPYCRTIISNPGYMKDNFIVSIDTLHLEDRGTTENAHMLPKEKLKDREVILIDIASDIPPGTTEDPTKCRSEKANRGPLKPKEWIKTSEPVMTCYKLVTVEFKWLGLQNRVESYIHKAEKRIFTRFHRQIFCWMDKWYDMTIEDIRAFEDTIKEDLEKERKAGKLKGGSLGPE